MSLLTILSIVACPFTLALPLPFNYRKGIRILGRKGLTLKSPDIIEKMNDVTDIVFDKTGTITLSN